MADSKELRDRQIKDLVNEMKLYNNPELLEETRKAIRKNVPLSMRGYLLAYLFVNSKHPATRTFEKKYDSQRQTAPRQEIEGAVSLYINVGKLSRTSAHSLIQFICEQTNLKEEDILSLAYKQNYSFIAVKEENAKLIIEKLNGATYRNRKIRVNYSKDSEADAN